MEAGFVQRWKIRYHPGEYLYHLFSPNIFRAIPGLLDKVKVEIYMLGVSYLKKVRSNNYTVFFYRYCMCCCSIGKVLM